MSKKLHSLIEEVVDALKKGVRDAGDAVSMRGRQLKTKSLDINGQWKETDELLSAAVPDHVSRKPKGMSNQDYRNLLDLSTRNPDSPMAVLGKWEGPTNPSSYTQVARHTDPPSTFFSLDAQWDDVKRSTGLSDKGMFEKFNVPFLDKLAADGKTIKFSHDPTNPAYANSALGDELRYLQKLGYRYDAETMTMVKK